MNVGATAQLSAVLDLVYEAPFSEGAWRPALTAIADFVKAESSDLNFFEPQFFTYRRWEHARIDTDTIQRYANAFMSDMRNVHPRVPVVMKLRNGEMKADSELWSVRERDRMPYFAEVFHRAGLRDGITACVSPGDTGGVSDLIVLGAYFDKPIAALPECRQRIGVLLPHLRRSCAVEAKLLQARKETAALTEVLDRISDAVAMLDRDGRLVFANARATAMLETNAALRLTADRRLWPSTGAARAALAQALTQCASSLIWIPGYEAKPATPVVIHRAEPHPLVLTLHPLPRDLVGAFGAVALMFVSDAGTRQADRRTALRAVYGLTVAESQLAQAICDGVPLKLYADTHDISYETARTYLRRVFEKTGTGRQPELASVVRALR